MRKKKFNGDDFVSVVCLCFEIGGRTRESSHEIATCHKE